MMNDFLTDSILKIMHSRHSIMQIHYTDFKKIYWPPFIERLKKKVNQNEILSDLKLGAMNKKVSHRIASKSIQDYYVANVAGAKDSFPNSSNSTIKINTDDGAKQISFTGHRERVKSFNKSADSSNGLHMPVGSLIERDHEPKINSDLGGENLQEQMKMEIL